MFHTSDYTIRFKHYRSKTKTGLVPKSTLCSIARNEEVVGHGRSKPVTEIPVECTKDELDMFLGRRIRRVYKFEDGRRIVILPGDNFSYARGRKEALKKAMEEAGMSKEVREAIWKAYKQNCK